MQQENTECRAFGTVQSANLVVLAESLRGMCFHYSELLVQEIVLQVPIQGGSSNTEIRLSRPIVGPKTPNTSLIKSDRWLVRHEGLPLRGISVVNLPAAVREITESYCTLANAPEFWESLGAKRLYEMEKNGREYLCNHQGYPLQVVVMRVKVISGPQSKPAVKEPKLYVIDVRVRVPEGQHQAAAQAIGSFGQKLSPLVTLQPALIPV